MFRTTLSKTQKLNKRVINDGSIKDTFVFHAIYLLCTGLQDVEKHNVYLTSQSYLTCTGAGAITLVDVEKRVYM